MTQPPSNASNPTWAISLGTNTGEACLLCIFGSVSLCKPSLVLGTRWRANNDTPGQGRSVSNIMKWLVNELMAKTSGEEKLAVRMNFYQIYTVFSTTLYNYYTRHFSVYETLMVSNGAQENYFIISNCYQFEANERKCFFSQACSTLISIM